MSGGIDSTAVVSLMKKAGQQKIRTLAVTFPGNELDESYFAKKAAEKYGVEHTVYPLTEKEVLDDIEKFITVIDQPTIDGLNTWFVSKAASGIGLKVVMSGLGGDELFGGYSTFRYLPSMELINRIPFSRYAGKAAAPFVKNLIPAKAHQYLKNTEEEEAAYKLFRDLFTEEEIKILFDESRPGFSQPVNNNHNNSDTSFAGRHNTLKYVSFLETTNYMANQLLRDSDMFSMCHSLELRVPFVDDRLYAAVLKYIDKGYDKNNPKKMLVDAVGDLPSEIVNRRKMGFTFPFDAWLRNGQLGVMVNDFIGSANSILNKKGVQDILRRFNSGKVHWSRLWALFVLSRFLKD